MAIHFSVIQCLFVLTVAIFIFAYVSFRSRWNLLRWLLAGTMVSLVMWALGESIRWLGSERFFYDAGIYIQYYGLMSTVPLWVLLALNYARVQWLKSNPQLIAFVSAPSVISYFALLTNDLHHEFIKDMSRAAMAESTLVWAGPILWFFIVWSFFCGLGTVALYLGAARRERGVRERHRRLWISGAAVLPLLTSGLVFVDIGSNFVDVTPTALSISVLILFGAVFRHRLFSGRSLVRPEMIEPLRYGVVFADGEGRITEINPAAEVLLGLTAAQVAHRQLAELSLVICENSEAATELSRRFQELSEAGAGFLFEVALRNGQRIEFDAVVIRHEEKVAGQYIVMRDRTEDHRDADLSASGKKLESVGNLVAGIAHEVNNPLAYVHSNLVYLERLSAIVQSRLDAFQAEEAKQLGEMPQVLGETLNGVERIMKMVRGLRRFSRVPSDEICPVDLNQVLEEALRLAELHENQGIAVLRHFGLELPTVQGSPERLCQVFLNLLLNAKHALRGVERGTILVETVRRGPWIEVRITDNGPGIEPDVLMRIFEPFFTTKGPEEGTGLGLAIVSDILHGHGGDIQVSSHPGQGASFVVHLPIDRPGPHGVATSRPQK